ncbi:hypothetical protein Tco_0687484, partial [Tanacetum coccineum]
MAMLTMRARRFLKNTGRKLIVNSTETNRWSVTIATKGDTLQGSAGLQGTKKIGICDQAEKVPTNFALMAYTSTISNSEVSTDSNSSSSCSENVKILKEQNEQLLKDLRTSKLNDIAYKTGLESVEARLLVYKKNDSVYEENIKVLKCEIHLREVAITELRRKLELAQKQKDEIQLTAEKFENSSKNLSKLLDFSEPTLKKPVFETSEAKTSEAKTSKAKPKVVRKNNGALIIESWVFDSEEEDVPQAKLEKKIVKPSFAKIEFVKFKEQVKSPRKTVNQINQNRQNTHTPRGNQRNWNNMMSQRLGRNFEMINKACYEHGSKSSMRSGLVSFTTARPVNTAQPKTTVNSARPMTNVFNEAHSIVRRPINNKTTTKNSNFNQKVNTVRGKNVNTARPKVVVNTARPKAILNAVKENQVNAVKASACWIQVSDGLGPQKRLGTCPILLTLKKLMEDMLPLEVTPKEGKSQAELTDESHVLLKVPRKNNMYSVDLKNIVPKGGLTCLFAKATSDESKLWH